VVVILQGCGPNDFNYGKVRNIIEAAPCGWMPNT